MAERLTIDHLQKVIEELNNARFDNTEWRDLGGTLGLYDRTLNTINANERGDVNGCFRKCLAMWLQRADDVDTVGKPSWISLVKALKKRTNWKAQAEYISKRGLIKGDSTEGKKPAKSMGPKIDSTEKTGAGYKDGGAQARDGIEETDGPAPHPAPQSPPDWPEDDKIVKRVPETQEFCEALVKDIKILLMPATTSEEGPVVYYLKQSSETFIETYIDGLRIYIGHYGKSKVIVVMTAPTKSRQGPIHAALITSKMLEKVPSIKYVVAVGVCFGMLKEKQKLGDVIISEMICDFTNKREGVGEENEYQRGPHYPVKPRTVTKFQPPHRFKMPHGIEVSIGVLISTGSLIDNPDVKQKLLEFRRDAIAGEMEGAGIITAIDYVPECVAEAIVIKGIGDWGDGDKEATKKWKPFAARAAAHYVYEILNK